MKWQSSPPNHPGFSVQGPIEAYVLGSDGNLWLENAPWGTVPSGRIEIGAGNIVAFRALGSNRGAEASFLAATVPCG
jgi:hypothetical protein